MTTAFEFNSAVRYRPGIQNPAGLHIEPLDVAKIVVQASGESFDVKYPTVFERYKVRVNSDALVNAWSSNPMQFWQNQLNFAIWCATTGCGVSIQDHLTSEEPLMRSLYRFHAYYQIRRILKELHVALPQDDSWSSHDNKYDRRAYERICNEFGVSPHHTWHVAGPNAGLGTIYNYWTRDGYRSVGGEYDPSRMSFTQETTNTVLHIDYIEQGDDKAWRQLILGKSDGFTRPGVERLNDSVRTYCWAILGAQAQTRTKILGTGTPFDAQKQFLANVEDAINRPVDLPEAIARYQEMLMFAGSVVNFCFGISLYMAPSDMLLRIGHSVGYNNEIVIATSSQKLGINSGLNVDDPPPPGTRKIVLPPAQKDDMITPPTTSVQQKADAEQHEAEKTALIVAAVAVGLAVIALTPKSTFERLGL